MDVIDEDGRLFGAVNVVDALVVLVVFAIALAGIALVTGEGPAPETGERYVTLDFGTQPSGVAEELDVGDTSPLAGELGNLTITDTYMMTSDSGVRVFARVAVTGRTTERRFTFDGEPLRIGRQVQFQNDTYVVNGTIQDIGNETDLPIQERTVVLRGTVPADIARNAEQGDEIRVDGRTLVTVRDAAAYDNGGSNRRTLYVDATLRTLSNGDVARFGDTPVEVGRRLSLSLAGSEYNGTIERVGGGLDRQTNEVLVTDVVDAGIADRLEEGGTYTVAGRTVATIESLTVYGTGNPDRKRVYVGLSVETLGYGDVPLFGANRSIREGSALPFRTESYEFTGEIVRVGALEQPGDPAERTLTLRMENVPPERADSVEQGLTETNGGQTVARIMDVQVEPAVITLTSESGEIFEREHPINKDVTLTVELQVREQASGIQFKGRILQEGNEIVLDLGTTMVRATVVDLDA
jgi:hypothetical protein